MSNFKVGVGFLGAGNISGIYLDNLTKVFRDVKVVGIYDIDEKRQRVAARKGYKIFESAKNGAYMYIYCNSYENMLHL